MIRLQTNGTALAVTEQTYPLTAGMAGFATAEFVTDALWAGLALTAVFSREGRSVLAPLENGRCTVPHELLTRSGTLHVGLFGTDGEHTLPSAQVALRVCPAVPTRGEAAENYTPSLYEQFSARFARIENLTASAAAGDAAGVTATEAGGALHLAFTLPKGDPGEQGATGAQGPQGEKGADGKDGYTPIKGVDYFDGADGSNGKDGEDGYTPIKGVDYFDGKDGSNGKDGEDGEDGYTPVRGIDYWTETDIAEIKSYVDDAILGGAW